MANHGLLPTKEGKSQPMGEEGGMEVDKPEALHTFCHFILRIFPNHGVILVSE